MAVRLSAVCTGRPLPPGRFLVLISVRACVNLRATVKLEGLGQLKKSNDTEPATFGLVAQCLDQLHYCVLPLDVTYEQSGAVITVKHMAGPTFPTHQ
jgi:hypothetical protein